MRIGFRWWDGQGDPLSPVDLLTFSSAGQAGRLQPTKLPGPTFDPQVYIPSWSYVSEHSEGMVIIGSQLLLSFLNYDVRNVPQIPLHKRLLTDERDKSAMPPR